MKYIHDHVQAEIQTCNTHPPQFQHVPLYLEWAPVGVFVAGKPAPGKSHQRHNLADILVEVRKEP